MSVEAWAQRAFGRSETIKRVLDSFGEVVHVSRPVIEMFVRGVLGREVEVMYAARAKL